MTNSTITLAQASNYTVEEFQAMTTEQLQEVHSVLSRSKQRKPKLQLDIVNAQLKQRKAPVKKAEEVEEDAVLVENSVKTVKKPSKPATKAKASTTKEPAKKVPAKTKAPAKSKISKTEKKALEDMSQEELLEYVKQMQAEKEKATFADIIPVSDTVQFRQIQLEGIKEIQNILVESPMLLNIFADEKLDDELTQFTVLFASSEVVVLLDRTRQKNTTVTLKPEQIAKSGKMSFGKDGTFDFRFYLRENIEQAKEA